jgi:ABC-type sugar transport system ATPase subunit
VSGEIRLADVGKVYTVRDGSVEAVKSVTLSVQGGEFVSLLGASGCGKSTLLTMIAGLTPVSRGEILIDNNRVTRPQTNIGFVFQEPVL